MKYNSKHDIGKIVFVKCKIIGVYFGADLEPIYKVAPFIHDSVMNAHKISTLDMLASSEEIKDIRGIND